MQEIFDNISNETKEIAEIAWRLAVSQQTPAAAASFLDNVVNYYSSIMSEEDINFLRFYFNMKMEVEDE